MRINGVNEQTKFNGFFIKENGVWKDLAKNGEELTFQLVKQAVMDESPKASRNIKYMAFASQDVNMPAILTGPEADEFSKLTKIEQEQGFFKKFFDTIQMEYEKFTRGDVVTNIPDEAQYDGARLNNFFHWEKQLS